jgi:oligoribonuclease
VSEALLWVDIETTGLDPVEDDILEFAYQATTIEGHPLPVAGMAFVNGDFGKCNEYVRNMHHVNGLDVEHSAAGFACSQDWVYTVITAAARKLQQWLSFEQVHLAGASVHFDRSFIERKAGAPLKFLTHRHVDVSTLKLALPAAGRKCPAVTPKIEHRAWWDVVAEIETYQAIHKILKGRE